MSNAPSDSADKIVVRLPDHMRGRLADLAKANNRSVNSEVVLALAAWLDPDPRVDLARLVRELQGVVVRLEESPERRSGSDRV